jgi:hypothetical protein
MTLEAAIRIHLDNIPELTALVGNRIFPGVAPEGTLSPYVAFFKISGAMSHNLPVAYPRYQFSCFAKSYTEAKEIAEQVRLAFQRYKGILGGAGGVRVKQAVYEGDIDLYEKDTGLHHVPVDVKFLYMG